MPLFQVFYGVFYAKDFRHPASQLGPIVCFDKAKIPEECLISSVLAPPPSNGDGCEH